MEDGNPYTQEIKASSLQYPVAGKRLSLVRKITDLGGYPIGEVIGEDGERVDAVGVGNAKMVRELIRSTDGGDPTQMGLHLFQPPICSTFDSDLLVSTLFDCSSTSESVNETNLQASARPICSSSARLICFNETKVCV
ncbi:hypothetical protein LWI29_020700 [Acer saccharum]|uniref:Uncharacterized protein n=1 Tax=Acer saccharum TaxID=4024 RepID=A0AA39SWA7_ACESA|nr:hypothetical protein LWI29_020700 [Acer saccharum]